MIIDRDYSDKEERLMMIMTINMMVMHCIYIDTFLLIGENFSMKYPQNW